MKKKEKSGWKEKSAETGKKLQNFVTARSLWQQDITFKERGAAGGKAATLIGITAWLYYRKIWAVPALIPLGIWLYREFLKEEKKKKEQEFQKQFREMIQSLSAALNTGYSVENAFYETQKELKILYQENITGELKMFKDSYNISEVFHKVAKLNTKRNIIGKDDEQKSVEKVIKINH